MAFSFRSIPSAVAVLICLLSADAWPQCTADPATLIDFAQPNDAYLSNSCAGYSRELRCAPVTDGGGTRCPFLLGQTVGLYDGPYRVANELELSRCEACDRTRTGTDFNDLQNRVNNGTLMPPFALDVPDFFGLYWADQNFLNGDAAEYECVGTCGRVAAARVVDNPATSETVEGALIETKVEERASLPLVVTELCGDLSGEGLHSGTCVVEADFAVPSNVVTGSSLYFHLGDALGRFVRLQVETGTRSTSCFGRPQERGFILRLTSSSDVALPWTSKRILVDGDVATGSLFKLRMKAEAGDVSITLGTRWFESCSSSFGSSMCGSCTYDDPPTDLFLVDNQCSEAATGRECSATYSEEFEEREVTLLDAAPLFPDASVDCSRLLADPIDSLSFGDLPAELLGDGAEDDLSAYFLARYLATYTPASGSGADTLASWPTGSTVELPHQDADSGIRFRQPPALDPCCGEPLRADVCPPCDRAAGLCP